MRSDYFVRPMTLADVPAVERLTDEAYLDVDVRTQRAGWPEPVHRGDEAAELWRTRVAHLVGTDPRGCWVAEDPRDLLGAAVSMKRDLTWLLATYAVRPGLQGRGVGRHLLEASMAYGSGCLRSMVASSDDPLAVRRYRLAGLTLHPSMVLRGTVPRTALPVVERVREGSPGDVDLMNSVDRQVRGAAHGPDHEVLTAHYRLLVVDTTTGSGYAYVAPAGGSYLLAATNRRTATSLLWEVLAGSSPNEPVTVACRLSLWSSGYLALQGMKPPAPYLHSGHFL